jgi:hypothetical protein
MSGWRSFTLIDAIPGPEKMAAFAAIFIAIGWR